MSRDNHRQRWSADQPLDGPDTVDTIRSVSDKPIKYVVRSYYHAVRLLGARGNGAEEVVSSD